MKVLKLLLVFVLVAGGIFLAIEWRSLFTPTGKGDDWSSEEKLKISEECDKIRNEWEACSGWDVNTYTKLRKDIDESKSMGLFSHDGYNTVNNCLRENSINKACEGYHTALGKRNSFNHADVVECYKGVEQLVELEQLDKAEIRINEVVKLHAFYIEVKNFAESRHGISPRFNTKKTTWTSFANIQSGVIGKGKNYSTNSLFKSIEHVPGLKEKLSESYIRNQTNQYRRGFYENLSSQIIEYFEEEEHNLDNKKLLEVLRERFYNEDKGLGLDKLTEYNMQYVIPVEQDSI